MDWNSIKKLIGKEVNVGIRNRFENNRLFYHAGKLTYVDEDSITLETRKGVLFLQKDVILQINLLTNSQRLP